MNWNAVSKDTYTQAVLEHWQKLGTFRKNHPAVGAGIHTQISSAPYVFSRTFSKGNYTDAIVIGLDLPIGQKEIAVGTIFKEGAKVKDAYSGKSTVVKNGRIKLDTSSSVLLIEKL
jgi:alpha-amylase